MRTVFGFMLVVVMFREATAHRVTLRCSSTGISGIPGIEGNLLTPNSNHPFFHDDVFA